MTNAKIGIALVGGYVLGRTKKAKLALGLGMYLAGKKLDLNPAVLGKALAGSPVLGELRGQAGEQLLTVAKDAVTKRVGSIADSLHSRTQILGSGPDERDGAADAEGADDEQDAEHEDEDGRGAGSGKQTGAPSRRASAGRTAKKAVKRPVKKAAGAAAGGAEGARKAAGATRGATSRTSRAARGTGGKGGDRG
jgi:hypothetical protein